MKSKFRTLVVNLLQLSAIFCLASCATVTIPKQIDIAATEVSDKIPLKAALYLSQGFRNAKYLMHQRQYYSEPLPIGDTLCYASETIIKNIFQEVIVLNSTDVLSDKSSEVIVTPEVITLDFDGNQCRGKAFTGIMCPVQTVIKWNIVSPEGKEIYASTVRSDEANIYLRSRHYWKQFIEMSLKNNFQKAQEDIYINAWWKKQWWKNNN